MTLDQKISMQAAKEIQQNFSIAQNLLLFTLQNEARGSTLFRADFHGRERQ